MSLPNSKQTGSKNSGRVRYVDRAYEAVKNSILNNTYPPGYQVLEQELADTLGMSRTPVREALIRLGNEGLIELIPRHGMRVIPLSPEDMKNIYEVLGGLESTAIKLIGKQNLKKSDYGNLLKATVAMEAALQKDDLEEWAKQDALFHKEIVELSGNPLLKSMVLSLNDKVHRARNLTLRLRPKPVNSTREHHNMVDALIKNDFENARAVHEAHRSAATKTILKILSSYKLNHV